MIVIVSWWRMPNGYIESSFDIDRRVKGAAMWIVTGGSSGIGAQLVSELHDDGQDVIVWDREEPTTAGIGFANIDLTAPGSIEKAATNVASPVDCFVHCAGGPSPTSIASEDAPERMRAAFELHVIAFVRSVRSLARQLAASNGSVVGVLSAAGESVYPGTLAYGASKSALERAIQQLAVELAPAGIRVNGVAPGAVATPMTAEYWADPNRAARRLKYIPLGYQGQPREISSVIRFLGSPGASYITGETVRVDGGSRLGMYSSGVRSAAPLSGFTD